jgi:23S rRNA (pseudouridine1915-N3)-methyltransferase
LRSLLSEYLGRLNHLATIVVAEVPDLSKRRGLRGAALLTAERAGIERALPQGCQKVLLDERGRQFSSPEFARWLESEQVRGAREIAFIIGGPEGVDPVLSNQAYLRLSLGNMTWTHEMARVLLLEQLYRALTILHNIPYHK